MQFQFPRKVIFVLDINTSQCNVVPSLVFVLPVIKAVHNYSVVSIKRTGSLNYFEVFAHPVLVFHVLNIFFLPHLVLVFYVINEKILESRLLALMPMFIEL